MEFVCQQSLTALTTFQELTCVLIVLMVSLNPKTGLHVSQVASATATSLTALVFVFNATLIYQDFHPAETCVWSTFQTV